MLTAGHLLFAWHCWQMVRGAPAERRIPQFHEVWPVLYQVDAVEPQPAGASALERAP